MSFRPLRVSNASRDAISPSIRAECKGGPLVKKRGGREHPILRGALGQVVTVEQVEANDLLVVAVPRTPRFRKLADRWRQAPLVVRSGIQIVLVGRDGVVDLHRDPLATMRDLVKQHAVRRAALASATGSPQLGDV